VLPFIDALIVGLLWTFGLVIMVNQRLAAELAEAKEQLEEIFDTSPDGALITSAGDGQITEVNRAFFGMMVYEHGIGREKRASTSGCGKTRKNAGNSWMNSTKRGMVENFETVFVRKDGSERFGLVSAKKITLHGKPHIISVTRDIHRAQKSGGRIKTASEGKRGSRQGSPSPVKNNFAVVSSLLNLQSRQIEDQRVRRCARQEPGPDRSMSLIHERLYQSKNLTHINLSEYMRSLANDLNRSTARKRRT